MFIMSKLSLVHLVHVECHGDEYGHLRADRSREMEADVFIIVLPDKFNGLHV